MKIKNLVPRVFLGPKQLKLKGLLIVFTGEGKGKTSSAMGVVLRALGHGRRVAIVQFMKGKWSSGEIKALQKFKGLVDVYSFGEGFTWETMSLKRDIRLAQKTWASCLRLLKENRHDVYVFDEILYALYYKFLPINTVINALRKRPAASHVILTGRHAPKGVVQMADLVTEMKEIKHPFRQGILAQPGIDF